MLLSTAASGNITVQYALQAATAASGVDYTYTGGTFTFTAGNRTGTINVSTIQDTIYEGSETFNIILSNALGGATISDGTGVATIVDNEVPVVINNAGTTIVEGDVGGMFSVSLNNAATGVITVNFRYSPLEATS